MRYFVVTLLLALAVLSSCAAPEKSAKPGEEFELKTGQTAAIYGENLRIKFVDVVSDSRCPRNVQCAWAGAAEIAFEVERGGKREKVILRQHGLTSEASQEFLGYEMRFNLEPYPEAGKKIAREEYVLKITIRRAETKTLKVNLIDYKSGCISGQEQGSSAAWNGENMAVLTIVQTSVPCYEVASIAAQQEGSSIIVAIELKAKEGMCIECIGYQQVSYEIILPQKFKEMDITVRITTDGKEAVQKAKVSY